MKSFRNQLTSLQKTHHYPSAPNERLARELSKYKRPVPPRTIHGQAAPGDLQARTSRSSSTRQRLPRETSSGEEQGQDEREETQGGDKTLTAAAGARPREEKGQECKHVPLGAVFSEYPVGPFEAI